MGVSYFKRNYNIHPIRITVNEYIKEINKIIKNDASWDKIFVATDDKVALALFSKAFADKIIYYPDVSKNKWTGICCF